MDFGQGKRQNQVENSSKIFFWSLIAMVILIIVTAIFQLKTQ